MVKIFGKAKKKKNCFSPKLGGILREFQQKNLGYLKFSDVSKEKSTKLISLTLKKIHKKG